MDKLCDCACAVELVVVSIRTVFMRMRRGADGLNQDGIHAHARRELVVGLNQGGIYDTVC